MPICGSWCAPFCLAINGIRAGQVPSRLACQWPKRRSLRRRSEAQRGDELALLVLDRIGTAQALQRLLGVVVAECGGALVIGLRGVLVLRPAVAYLREGAHSLQRAGVVLRRRLLEQQACRDVVPCPAGAIGE